jgi:hypothetical protein
MVEIKLRWRIKYTKKYGKTYPVCYISVPSRSAIFLLDHEPVLDPTNKVIIFKPKQSDTKQNNEVRLKWRIKHTKKDAKIYPLYYISVPYRSAIFLLDHEPVLDPVNKVIIFKPKQNTQQNSTQNQPQSQ